jgi:hypothetical protein
MRMSPATRAKLNQKKIEAPEKISKAFEFFKNDEISQGMKILENNAIHFSETHFEEYFNYFKLFYSKKEFKIKSLYIITCVPKKSISNKEDLYQFLHKTIENEWINNLELLELLLKIYRKSFSNDSKLMKKSLSFLSQCVKVKKFEIQVELNFIFDEYLSNYENIEDILEYDLIDDFIQRYQESSSMSLEYLYVGNSKTRNLIQSRIGSGIHGKNSLKNFRFNYIHDIYKFSNQIYYCHFNRSFPCECIPLQSYYIFQLHLIGDFI